MSLDEVPERNSHWKTWIIVILKFAVTFGLLYVVFTSTIGGETDLQAVIAQIAALEFHWILVALALFYLQFATAAIRQRSAVRCLGGDIGLASSFSTVIMGYFFAQVFATFIGGDAMRVWRISRQGLGLRDAASAVLIDRAFGFMAILVLVASLMPVTWTIVTDSSLRTGLLLGALVGLSCVLGFFLFGLMPEFAKRFRFVDPVLEMTSASRHVVRKPVRIPVLLGPSVMIQITNVLIVWVLGYGLGADWSLMQAFALVPIVVLLATLPISFAGWGVREGAMVHALAFIAIPAEIALATSVLFGIGLLFSSLPGAILWWSSRKSGVAQANA